MKAWILKKHGTPEVAFEMGELPDPVPNATQVLLDVEGFGLNFADTMARQGLYREAPPLPSVIGYEVVGRVEELGSNVPKELMGKRVIAFTRFGGYATKVATDHRALAVIPEDMDVGVATALGTQYVTAWYAARYACPLRKGQRVLVHSAAGGVGQALVQLALNAGCEVFGVAAGASKMEFLKNLGVQHMIDRKAGPYEVQIRERLDGKRIDVSFNAVAGRSFRQDMKLLGSGGAIVLYGGAARSGKGAGLFSTLKFVWDMGLVLPIGLMMRSKSIIGINMLKMGDHHPELVAQCFNEVVAAAAAGKLRPHVHQVFAAGDLAKAHTLLSSGETIGKVAIKW